MSVGAAESEGADSRPPGNAGGTVPISKRGVYIKGAVVKIDMRVCLLKMKGGDQFLILQA